MISPAHDDDGSQTHQDNHTQTNHNQYSNGSPIEESDEYDSSCEEANEQPSSSYLSLLKSNRPLRLFLLSYAITQVGNWFTYIASLVMLQNILEERRSSSKVALSTLVVLRLSPNFFMFASGGVLADARDRRNTMVWLNLGGGVVGLLLLVAYYQQSVFLLFLLTFVQQCFAALYEPCRAAVLPMTVATRQDLKKTATMEGVLWSLMFSVGSALGGLVVHAFGIPANFLLDCGTFVTSAALLCCIGGDWNPREATQSTNTTWKSPFQQMYDMSIEGGRYLTGQFFAPLVLFKASAASVYGSSDVLNVSFAQHNGKTSTVRLGYLFGMVGFGCVLGPILDSFCTDASRMRTIQASCIFWLACGTVGCLGLGDYGSGNFLAACFFSLVRSTGSSVVWINSGVLLQVRVCAQLHRQP